jgi:hypothetical protein
LQVPNVQRHDDGVTLFYRCLSHLLNDHRYALLRLRPKICAHGMNIWEIQLNRRTT